MLWATMPALAQDVKLEKQSAFKIGNDPPVSSSSLMKMLRTTLGSDYQDLELVIDACHSGEFTSRATDPRYALGGNWSCCTSSSAETTATVRVTNCDPRFGYHGLKIDTLYYHGYVAQYIKKLKEAPTTSNKDLHAAAVAGNMYSWERPQYASSGPAADRMTLHGGKSSNHAIIWSAPAAWGTELTDALYATLKAAGYTDSTIDLCRGSVVGGNVDRAGSVGDFKNALAALAAKLLEHPHEEKAFIFIDGHGNYTDRELAYAPFHQPGVPGNGMTLTYPFGQVAIAMDSTNVGLLKEEAPKSGGGYWADAPSLHRIRSPILDFTTAAETVAPGATVSVFANGHAVGSVALARSSTGGEYELAIPDSSLDAILGEVSGNPAPMLTVRFEFSSPGDSIRLATDDDFLADTTMTLLNYGVGLGAVVDSWESVVDSPCVPPPSSGCGPDGSQQGVDLKLSEAGPHSGPFSDPPGISGSTTWLMYPQACFARVQGTWSPSTSPVSDSLNSYDVTTQNHGYCLDDQSLKEILWHIDDGSTKDVSSGPWPLPIDGVRSLWMGKTDPNWVVKSGYPNLTYQILYFDTDLSAAGGGAARASAYTLSWSQYLSSEFNYDYMYVIGGSDGKDPIGNSRVALDAITSSGSDATGELLITFTGSQVASQTLTYTPGGVVVQGSGSSTPSLVAVTLANIPASVRAIYIVFTSDGLSSSEDGLWPLGHGTILDLVGTSDQGLLYDDQTAVGGMDSVAGNVLVGTPANPLISARVAPGVGTLWQVVAGNNLPTGDYCSPQKSFASDIEFFGGDASLKTTIPNTFASITSCTFPLPPSGAASVRATWREYLDLPRQSGFVQYAEYRVFKNGTWSNWRNTRPTGGLTVGALQAWLTDGGELPEATQADSVQLRFNMECIGTLAVDHVNCQPVTYGVLYDDFNLQVTSGVPKPAIGLFPGSMPQTTFVDGTDPASVNCTAGQIAAGQCWPGVRGSGLDGSISIHDNFNSPLGDSIVVTIQSGLRRNGMGINWRNGFDKSVNAGLTIAHTNRSFNPLFDVPRVIYALFDPATMAWSPWDSSELDADAVAIRGADTVLINSSFRMNWPPRDKLAAAATLPGGFSINGKTRYSQLAFLPKGCQMEYYFKGVDINGGTAYAPIVKPVRQPFDPNIEEFEPLLVFNVLPGVYPPGTGGTLLAGRTDTPILNLDGAYSAWSFSQDPVTQALRAMGVRADRYRYLQGLDEGNNIGGHELPGQRQPRLSNYFPNIGEYGILATLANQYRVIIQSSHLRTSTVADEQDAILLRNWWNTDTGLDGGDRCIFTSGDDFFSSLLNASLSFPQHGQQVSLAQDVFGVTSCVGSWTGTSTNAYPSVTDAFAGISYPVDGGCPGPNRFDGLVKGGAPDITTAATYPSGSEVAGLERMTENDATGSTDNDRSKALGYGFSIQFIRKAGIPSTAANYVHSGVENRMLVLYKFLTSCRGQRTPGMTNVCWPCPSNASDLVGNWAAAGTNFNTALSGPLYAIQDNTQATGVPDDGPGVPAYVNALSQNRPNPFNPETVIPYSLATPGKVTIRIFNVAGQCIRTLADENQPAGPHLVRWNGQTAGGRRAANGIFFYRITYPDGTTSAKKMAVLR